MFYGIILPPVNIYWKAITFQVLAIWANRKVCCKCTSKCPPVSAPHRSHHVMARAKFSPSKGNSNSQIFNFHASVRLVSQNRSSSSKSADKNYTVCRFMRSLSPGTSLTGNQPHSTFLGNHSPASLAWQTPSNHSICLAGLGKPFLNAAQLLNSARGSSARAEMPSHTEAAARRLRRQPLRGLPSPCTPTKNTRWAPHGTAEVSRVARRAPLSHGHPECSFHRRKLKWKPQPCEASLGEGQTT